MATKYLSPIRRWDKPNPTAELPLLASLLATHRSPCSRPPRAAATWPSEGSFFSARELGALAGLILRIYTQPPASAPGCWQDQSDSVGRHRAGDVGGGWEPSSLTIPGWGPSMDLLGTSVWESWSCLCWRMSSIQHHALLSQDSSN